MHWTATLLQSKVSCVRLWLTRTRCFRRRRRRRDMACWKTLLRLVVVLASVAAALAVAPVARAELTTPELSAASFAAPSMAERPKYRWWMPLAYTDDDELRAELRDMAAAGGGGV